MEDRLRDLAAATAIAERAGLWVLKRRRSGVIGVQAKAGPLDWFTDLDRGAEKRVLRGIRKRWPEDLVFSEEGSDPAGAFRLGHGDGPTGTSGWLVDPIDGTVNCVRQIGPWAIAMCRIVDGETDLAVVHLPETGESFGAARGAGFFVNGTLRYNRADDQRRRPDGPPLSAGVVETCIFDRSWPYSREGLSAVFAQAKQSRVFNATLPALAWLADGRLDGCIGMKLAPWDWMPGALLVSESGGVVGKVGVFDYAAGRGCAAEIEACLRAPQAEAERS